MSTISISVEGKTEAALVTAVPELVSRLLGEPVGPVATPVAVVAEERSAPPAWTRGAFAAGGVALVAGVVAGLLGVGLGAVALGTYAAWWSNPDAITGRPLRTALLGVVGGGSVVGIGAVFAGLAACAAGGAALVAGLVGGIP